MAVLTKKEYEKTKGTTPKKIGVAEKFATPSFEKDDPIPEVKEPLMEYVLFYPDNPSDRYFSGTTTMEVLGERVSYEIENGCVRVYSEEECKAFKEAGYTFIKKKEVTE